MVVTTPPSKYIFPDNIVAEPGVYRDIYYIKLTWAFPDFNPNTDDMYYNLSNIWYEVERESLTTPGTWVVIGTSQGGNNVFFDSAMSVETEVVGMILPNTEYTYRVWVNTRNGRSTPESYTYEVSAKSPNFSRYVSPVVGSNGWSLRCGLKIYDGDDSGKPGISVIGYTEPLYPISSAPMYQTSATTEDYLGGQLWTITNQTYPQLLASSDLSLAPIYIVAKLRKSGGAWSSVYKETGAVTSNLNGQYYSLGESSEMWGFTSVTLTAADINNSGFAVGLWAYDSSLYGGLPDPRHTDWLIASDFDFAIPVNDGLGHNSTILGIKVEVKACVLHRIYGWDSIQTFNVRTTVYYTFVTVPYSPINPNLEMAIANGAWTRVQDCTNIAGFQTGTITPANSLIDFNKECKVRMTDRDNLGNIISQTNTVNITTYSPNSTSFPNMLPNSGLQYGFYDTNPTGGTYTRYTEDVGDVSYIVSTPTTIDLITGTTSTEAVSIDFYSKKALKSVTESKDCLYAPYEDTYTMNLSAYNFPGHPLININRYYGFSGRLVENLSKFLDYWFLYGFPIPIASGCKAEISRTTEYGESLYYDKLIRSEDAYRADIGTMTTLAGSTGEHGKLVTAVFADPIANPMTSIIIPAEDAYISFNNPDMNYVTSTDYIEYDYLRVQNVTDDKISLLYFNLDGIPPNSIINSAEIYLCIPSGVDPIGAFTFSFYNIETDWEESTVTWNNQPTWYDDYVRTIGDLSTTGYTGWFNTTDMKTQFQKYVNGTVANRGMVLKTAIPSSIASPVAFASSRKNEDKPYLSITYTVPGNQHHNQSRLQFRAKRYNFWWNPLGIAPVAPCEIYIGDMMLFDLSSIFGGNGGDIYDTSSEITALGIQHLVDVSLDGWWEFDYSSNVVNIPYNIEGVGTDIPLVTGTVVICELWNVRDDAGGMDTTGGLPANNFSLQYKKMGNNFYEEKGPFEINSKVYNNPLTDDSYMILGTEDETADYRLDPGTTYQLRYLYTNSGGQPGFSKSVFIETAPYPERVENVEMNRWWETGASPKSHLTITWDIVPEVPNPYPHEWYKVIGYNIQISTDGINWSDDILVSGIATDNIDITSYNINSVSYNIKPEGTDYTSLVYFCRVCAYNAIGDGPW